MDEFEQAREDFFAEISEEERVQFSKIKSSKEFLDEFKKFEQFDKNKKKWVKVFKAVKGCSDKLEPYFETLSTFVSSLPDWAAIAWGAFRLVLQMSCNFLTFFEKLGDMLAQLSSKIPVYTDVKKYTGKTISERFQASLRAFYVDLFEVFRGIARIFTQKSGKLRKTPVVIGQLLWQPFDVRFENILKRLDIHRELLKLEMDVMHFQTSRLIATNQVDELDRNEKFRSKMLEHNNFVCSMKEEFDEIQKCSLVNRVKAWIDPPEFVEAFDRSTKLRQDGTAEWVFDVEIYQKWLHDPVDNACDSMKRFFWIRGNPGTGKTILAASVVQELMACDTALPDSQPLVSYFFFDYAVPNMCRRDQAYRAILCRLLERFRKDNEILEIFSFPMTKCNDGQLIATTEELLGLIMTLANRIDGWYIVIDAVDECEDSGELLSELFRVLADQPTKLLFFSRPNVRLLRQKLKTPQILTISRSSVESDLRLFFDTQLQDLQDNGIIPCAAQRGELIEYLITGADGMFQWARLMITHLQSEALLDWERISIITKLTTPEKLDDMYIRILDLLARKLTSEQSLARRLFLWLVFGKVKMSASQLQDILTPVKEDGTGFPKEIYRREKTEEFVDFEHSIIMISGSLVEHRRYGNSQVDTYCFVHRSVIEFFKTNCENETAVCGSRAGSRNYFLPPRCEVEAELATSCLAYIFQRIPGEPLSGDMFEAALGGNLRDIVPFFEYAALYWPHHLLSMQTSLSKMREPGLDWFYQTVEKLLAIIGRFLLNRLLPMVWVEATYTCEKGSAKHTKIHSSLLQWAAWAQTIDRSRVTEDSAEVPIAVAVFAEDLAKLHELWGDTLLNGPHQIWHDITAFTTSPFFVQTSAVTIKSLAAESSNLSGLSTIPLSKISRDDPRTHFMAVLTIWLSKDFEISWRKSSPRQKQQSNATQFDGWIAQYELWNIENDPIVVDDSRIPIDKDEVQLQYQRFQKYVKTFSKTTSIQTSKKELALHFPTSISDGLNTITILRTVYKRPRYVGSESSKLDASAKSWLQILMPIIHTIDSTLLQGPSERLRVGKTEVIQEARSFAQICDTVLKFDRTPAFRMITYENYVLYQSVEGREALTQDEDGAATIAVYQLANGDEADEIKLLGCIEGDGNQGSINHCVFHPTLPLLALNFRSTTGPSQILLWCFARKTALNTSSIVLLSQSLLQKKESFSTSSVCTGTGRLKHLQFSACGTYIIFQTHTSSNQELKHIEAFHAYRIAVEHQSISKAKYDQPAPSFLNPKIQMHALERPNSLPNAMSLNQPVHHGSGISTTLSFQPEASNRSIKLVHSTNGFEEEQTLLSLPAWNDIGNVSVSLRLPSKTREDKVTIILNKTAQPFYTLSKAGEHTTPAVVMKDIRAIAKPKVSNSIGSAKRQSSWHGIGFKEDRDQDDEIRLKKRARIDDSRGPTKGDEGGQAISEKGASPREVIIELGLEEGLDKCNGNVDWKGWGVVKKRR